MRFRRSRGATALWPKESCDTTAAARRPSQTERLRGGEPWDRHFCSIIRARATAMPAPDPAQATPKPPSRRYRPPCDLAMRARSARRNRLERDDPHLEVGVLVRGAHDVDQPQLLE